MSVPIITVMTVILVSPDAYETRSDEVNGFNLSSSTIQNPCFSIMACSFPRLSFRKNEAVHFRPNNERMSEQEMPAPSTFPASESDPPTNPPNITPPGKYRSVPGMGATTTSIVTMTTYTTGEKAPHCSKKSFRDETLDSASRLGSSRIQTMPPLEYDHAVQATRRVSTVKATARESFARRVQNLERKPSRCNHSVSKGPGGHSTIE